jgi:hypothetical protein
MALQLGEMVSEHPIARQLQLPPLKKIFMFNEMHFALSTSSISKPLPSIGLLIDALRATLVDFEPRCLTKSFLPPLVISGWNSSSIRLPDSYVMRRLSVINFRDLVTDRQEFPPALLPSGLLDLPRSTRMFERAIHPFEHRTLSFRLESRTAMQTVAKVYLWHILHHDAHHAHY